MFFFVCFVLVGVFLADRPKRDFKTKNKREFEPIGQREIYLDDLGVLVLICFVCCLRFFVLFLLVIFVLVCFRLWFGKCFFLFAFWLVACFD